MNDLTVNITPAIVTANFTELKAYLEVEVAKYDVEVTETNVTEAKKLATELNAVTKGISDVKKKQLEILEAPVKEFKAQIAELNDIVQGGRSKILNQVKEFEDRTKQMIKDLLLKTLEDEVTAQDLGDGYADISILDLVLLGSLTKSGNLTKKAVDEVINRVAEAKARQRADEAEAEAERLRREAEIQKRIEEQRIKDAREDERRLEAARNITHEDKPVFKDVVEKPQDAIKTVQASEPIQKAPEGKKRLTIAIEFDVLVRATAEDEKVLKKMRDILENAGIPQLTKITIEG